MVCLSTASTITISVLLKVNHQVRHENPCCWWCMTFLSLHASPVPSCCFVWVPWVRLLVRVPVNHFAAESGLIALRFKQQHSPDALSSRFRQTHLGNRAASCTAKPANELLAASSYSQRRGLLVIRWPLSFLHIFPSRCLSSQLSFSFFLHLGAQWFVVVCLLWLVTLYTSEITCQSNSVANE